MRRNETIVSVRIGEILQARFLQFHAHHDGKTTADNPRDQREDQIHHADVFVVGRINVASPSRGIGMAVMRVIVVLSGGLCH